MNDARDAVLTGFGVGVALASAPGAVQAVLLSEAARGGLVRGLRALLGSSVTSAFLLVSLALGLSVVAPTGIALQVLKVVGGSYLLWLAADAFRSAPDPLVRAASARRRAPAVVLGSLAVLLNPGSWMFLGTVASPLFVTASRAGGVATAVTTAIALLIGVSLGDAVVVALSAFGLRQAHDRMRTWIRRGLACVLGVLALALLASGFVP